jgi:hypothetical protein
MERSENKTKKSKKLPSFSLPSEMKRKGRKKLPSFSLRSEMKQNGSEKLPSFTFQSEMEANFFRFHAKNEMKRKRNKKEAKTSKRKRIE